jgi:hypothetical protein
MCSTHTDRLLLHIDGTRCRGCHPSHFNPRIAALPPFRRQKFCWAQSHIFKAPKLGVCPSTELALRLLTVTLQNGLAALLHSAC